MASIVVAGDTSGTVTLAAPATAGTTTLTLPTVNGTVLTTGSSISTSQLSGSIPRASLPAGSVLQVVSTTKTDFFSTSSSSFVDITGYSVVITPTSATSKILVLVDLSAGIETEEGFAKLVRNSTDVYIGDANGSAPRVTAANMRINGGASTARVNMVFLDSPATTAATTYKAQVRTRNSVGTVRVNINNDGVTNDSQKPVSASSITVMEIAA